MPELPEVETMVRGIRSHLEGARVRDLVLPPCTRKPIFLSPEFPEMQAQAAGQRIERVERRAKRIVIELENQSSFVIEPRMTGLMIVDQPPSREHLRLEWRLVRQRRRYSVWFWDRRGLGTVRLFSQQQREEHLGADRLGPDALEMSVDDWQTRLKATDRMIKVALLDQKLVAGIGNLYASEILHRAGISPLAICSRLSRRKIEQLQASTLEILEEAIRYEGSTLADGTYRNALNKDGSYQNKHRVYSREGVPCPTCGRGTIERIVQAQRSTFFCRKCQKSPGTR